MKLSVNGVDHDVEASNDMPLLWVLRDLMGLTGTKFGCGIAQCGACTVHIDGVATRSCVRPVSSIDAGAKITTIEGISGKVAETLQTVWADLDVPQCGYCQSGQIMSAAALLTTGAAVTDDSIRKHTDICQSKIATNGHQYCRIHWKLAKEC